MVPQTVQPICIRTMAETTRFDERKLLRGSRSYQVSFRSIKSPKLQFHPDTPIVSSLVDTLEQLLNSKKQTKIFNGRPWEDGVDESTYAVLSVWCNVIASLSSFDKAGRSFNYWLVAFGKGTQHWDAVSPGNCSWMPGLATESLRPLATEQLGVSFATQRHLQSRSRQWEPTVDDEADIMQRWRCWLSWTL